MKLLRALDGYDHVIWDWNGTLLDDVLTAVTVKNQVLDECGLPLLTIERYREIFAFPVIDYYRKLGFDFDTHPFQRVADRFIELYAQAAPSARLFDGTTEILAQVRAKTRHQSILSAASQTHLDTITEHFGVRSLFDHIYGIGDHYAGSKLQRGFELLAASGVPASRTILIGDTDHDFEVARELGIHSLLVADGHQSYERLHARNPGALTSRFD